MVVFYLSDGLGESCCFQYQFFLALFFLEYTLAQFLLLLSLGLMVVRAKRLYTLFQTLQFLLFVLQQLEVLLIALALEI